MDECVLKGIYKEEIKNIKLHFTEHISELNSNSNIPIYLISNLLNICLTRLQLYSVRIL